jgi:hypothetical protein
MQMFQSNLSAMTWNDVNFFAQLQITVINASLRQRHGCMEVMKIMHICKIKYAHNILCSLLSTLENWKYYVLLVLELTICILLKTKHTKYLLVKRPWSTPQQQPGLGTVVHPTGSPLQLYRQPQLPGPETVVLTVGNHTLIEQTRFQCTLGEQ